MGKLSIDDLDRYTDSESLERFKKKSKTTVKKKRDKINKRKNYVDPSQIDWESDENNR